MAKTLTVAGLKGGAGKTTVVLSLADFFRVSGFRVLILDADPQGTCRHWADIAEELKVDAPPVVQATGPSMRKAAQAVIEAGVDILLIDTPPRLGTEAKIGMSLADVVLVPISPGPGDVWALGETQQVVEEAQAFRPELIARIVLNRIDQRTAIAEALKDGAASASITLLEETLGNRVAFPESISAGQGPATYVKASTAAAETAALGEAVLRMLGVERGDGGDRG